MATYLIAETAVGAAITAWRPCMARSLQGAKRAAQDGRVFQRTEAHVGMLLSDGSIMRIATRRPSGEIRPGWH